MNSQLERRLIADAQELERDFPSAADIERRIVARLAISGVKQRPQLTLLQELAVAGLFVIAVGLLAIGIGRLRALNHEAPVRPQVSPSPSAQGGSACMGYGPAPWQGAPIAVKMMSPTTGWGPGGLRTTDGGTQWRDTSPAALRSDAPANFGRTVYPPYFGDFYLDATHAWEIRGYPSSSSCVDHLAVFVTADGGRKWRQSEPVGLKLGAGMQISQPRLFFIDPQHGWALVAAGPMSFGPYLDATTSANLFRTSDGGLHWSAVADVWKAVPGIKQAPNCLGVFGDLTFASESMGWISIPGCQQPGPPEILASHDGGVTWSVQPLPTRSTCPCTAGPPTFFDARQGIVLISDKQSTPALYETSDGGRTWQSLAPLPANSIQMSFVSANDFWDIVAPPGWTKMLGSPRDWLFRSTDGGRTWQLVQTDLPIGYPVGALTFFDANHGFAAQTGPRSQTELLATSDGGHSWKVVGEINSP